MLMLYAISEVRVFASGLNHPEGIAVGRDGTVYAGGEAGEVYRISPAGQNVEVIANTGGFCLGVTLDENEDIFICDCAKRAILKVQQNGHVTTFAESVENQPFRNPNFSVFDSQGNLYFSDSGEWKKAYGIICRSDPNGKTTLFSPGPFHFANGLALDALEKYLYMVESNLDRVLQIEIKSDGTAGSMEVYADGLKTVPDGFGV